MAGCWRLEEVLREGRDKVLERLKGWAKETRIQSRIVFVEEQVVRTQMMGQAVKQVRHASGRRNSRAMDERRPGMIIENRTRWPIGLHGGKERVRFEWNVDCDDFKSVPSGADGREEQEVKTKWRCKECWGGVTGRLTEEGKWTGFKCRVCGLHKVGDGAQEEYEAVEGRGVWEEMCRRFGMDGKEQKGPEGGRLFVLKRFPNLGRRKRKEVSENIRRNQQGGNKTLDRKEFPEGMPAALTLEAKLLMASVAQFPLTERRSVGRIAKLARDKDGNRIVDISVDTEERQRDTKYQQREEEVKMGTTLATAMMGAFSCELVMKAIALTCTCKTKRTHNLADLYAEMPQSSRSRVEADFPEIQQVMGAHTKTFSSWRYFDMPSREPVVRNMTDVEAGRALSKAARVLLDEAEICGLASGMEVSKKVIIDETPEGGVSFHEHTGVSFGFEEHPPSEAELDCTE